VAHPVGLSERGLAVARLSAGVVVRLLAEEVHQVVAGARILAVVAVEGPSQTRRLAHQSKSLSAPLACTIRLRSDTRCPANL